jgi:ABC-type antimicrobial peptide transport system permease subunit
MRQVTLGLAIGLVLAVGMGMALAIFLYQVRPYDPVTFTLVPALLAAVSLAACLVPARRASAVDPIVALRYE